MGAGLNACTRDLARFGQMLLQQGVFNGNECDSGLLDSRDGNG